MTIFLISGMSGVGKTTIADQIARHGYWKECISHTTRKMRKGEEEGKTYHYITKDEFVRKMEMGEFIEVSKYSDEYYGITREEIERVMKESKNVYVIVDYDGYIQIKNQYPDAVGIFLYMSKEECVINMLNRGDSLENALKRVETYSNEFASRIHYNYIIKNVKNKQHITQTIVNNIIQQYK